MLTSISLFWYGAFHKRIEAEIKAFKGTFKKIIIKSKFYHFWENAEEVVAYPQMKDSCTSLRKQQRQIYMWSQNQKKLCSNPLDLLTFEVMWPYSGNSYFLSGKINIFINNGQHLTSHTWINVTRSWNYLHYIWSPEMKWFVGGCGMTKPKKVCYMLLYFIFWMNMINLVRDPICFPGRWPDWGKVSVLRVS